MRYIRTAALLGGAGLLVGVASPAALAQQSASGIELQDTLSEVTVTATRRDETVNRVAMSVSAITQDSLDRQGVRNIDDLSRSAPAVSFRERGRDGSTNISIRGIASVFGAPTTGLYIDDVPLQKRLANGSVTGSGTPVPLMFDLDRVEILRGPQGTLYGGSSQGGTIRFITPTPSLTDYSVSTRVGASMVSEGGSGYEAGFAVGAPVIEDTLGIRVTAFNRYIPGYLDHVSVFSGDTLEKDTNWNQQKLLQVQALWQPRDDVQVRPSIYYATDYLNDPNNYWEKIPAYTTAPQSYNNSTLINPETGLPYPNTYFPGVSAGPYDQFGPYRSGVNFVKDGLEKAAVAPRGNSLTIPSLTLDFDLGAVSIKSITARLRDVTNGRTAGITGVRQNVYNQTANGAIVVIPGFDFWDNYFFVNRRTAFTQEVRVSSRADARFNWVTGVFYSDATTTVDPTEVSNDEDRALFVRGVPFSVITGTPILPGSVVSHRYQQFKEREMAVFGEGNFNLTPKLKLTAGVRLSDTKFDFYQFFEGPLAGRNSPVITEGVQKERPVTPKLSVAYQFDDENMMYATIARGFRPGGTNSPIPLANCAVDLAALGGEAAQPPPTYGSDKVTSYEVGAKVRTLGGRAQINSSVFYIDWADIQAQTQLRGCGFQYIVNGASAVSKGADVQADILVVPGFILSGTVGYNDAAYDKAVLGPEPPAGLVRQVLFNKGDELGASKWSYTLAGMYSGRISADLGWNLQANYQYQGPYKNTPSEGAFGYDAYAYRGAPVRLVNARAGLSYGRSEVSVYANNLTDSRDLLSDTRTVSGVQVIRRTVTPRTIGAQWIYRY